MRRELGDKRSAEDLLGVVSAEADENGTFVNVIARDESASGAARLANAFADQFIAVRAESVGARVQRAIEAGSGGSRGCRAAAANAPASARR